MTKKKAIPAWHAKRTDETRNVEETLKGAGGFEQVDAYRYNSASIRVRVVDKRFEGKSRDRRDAMVEKCLTKLPAETLRDIVSLFTFTPSELESNPATFREFLQNTEFEDPSPSML